ncbi:unnamed protein product [Pleuronectes platessa]|uniref:Uncharacterized protein n=1 Tax=Pleuronectes platessa TaxID=8262 RepID=A0A9N7TNJ9_PLEPL|nr:unnamed protein product [Pleuronectes platessa]
MPVTYKQDQAPYSLVPIRSHWNVPVTLSASSSALTCRLYPWLCCSLMLPANNGSLKNKLLPESFSEQTDVTVEASQSTNQQLFIKTSWRRCKPHKSESKHQRPEELVLLLCLHFFLEVGLVAMMRSDVPAEERAPGSQPPAERLQPMNPDKMSTPTEAVLPPSLPPCLPPCLPPSAF